ncbi:MAG: hypothetical protein P9L97_00300 [Candidatus Tenebribacter davisii]|nr:hypothetical protein [Candidatus Tenebribacter davisii]
MEVTLIYFAGFLLGALLLTGMILTLVGIHKDVYRKPPQYATQLHLSEHIYNYPIWMQKCRYYYTILGALGYFALFFIPITSLLDTYINKYEILIMIISCCVIFAEFILYKGYDTFAKELRIKKYRVKLEEIEFDKASMSDYEYCVAKERILKFKS